mmetsp:Transcript_58914/g.156852  ORF Transcript_58914/g.156852 Transcript_58914/m.156852 type:complete len:225 (-) Transcript_58914:397-1071(-)
MNHLQDRHDSSLLVGVRSETIEVRRWRLELVNFVCWVLRRLQQRSALRASACWIRLVNGSLHDRNGLEEFRAHHVALLGGGLELGFSKAAQGGRLVHLLLNRNLLLLTRCKCRLKFSLGGGGAVQMIVARSDLGGVVCNPICRRFVQILATISLSDVRLLLHLQHLDHLVDGGDDLVEVRKLFACRELGQARVRSDDRPELLQCFLQCRVSRGCHGNGRHLQEH